MGMKKIWARRSRRGFVRWGMGATLAILVMAGLGTTPGVAATEQFLDSRALEIWKQEDACVANSIKQFPDHDLASLQSRDRSVDACTTAHDLPPRTHLVPDP